MIKRHLLKRKMLILVISLVLPFQWACDDTVISSIPEASVSFTCNMVQNPYSILVSQGQYIKVSRSGGGFTVYSTRPPFTSSNYAFHFGYSGLIIGNSFFNGYCAYDLCCPYEHDRSIAVDVRFADGKAICPKCKTEYDLNNGGIPVKGVSKEGLKRYNTYLNGQNLIIRN